MENQERTRLEKGMTVYWRFTPAGGFGYPMFLPVEVVSGDARYALIDFWDGYGERQRKRVKISQLVTPCEDCEAEMDAINQFLACVNLDQCDCMNVAPLPPLEKVA